MRWFKHLSDASRNKHLSRLRDEYGLEGYARYWLVLELVAEQSKGDEFATEMPARAWARHLDTKATHALKFLRSCHHLGLILCLESGQIIRIEVPKMAEYKDEYTRKLLTKSGATPDKVASESEGEKERSIRSAVRGGKSARELRPKGSRATSPRTVADILSEAEKRGVALGASDVAGDG